MALALLFIVDPLDELKAYKDSSVAMMREAVQRGYAVHASTPAELAATNGTVSARAHRLEILQDNHDWKVEQDAEESTSPVLDIVGKGLPVRDSLKDLKLALDARLRAHSGDG